MTRLLPLFAVLAAIAIAPSAARADDADDGGPRRYVAVQGSGSVTATPDQAHINTGVTSRADTARQALDANNAAMSRLMAALKEAGVDADDIRTSNFSVSPWYEPYVRNRPRVIAGYQASNQVRVRIRDIARLGPILDAVVTAGSNRVNGVQFSIEKPQEKLDQARRSAIADARRRAALYAEAAGAEIGKVLSIDEQGSNLPRPRLMAADALMKSEAVPVSPGTQEITASVSVRFELK